MEQLMTLHEAAEFLRLNPGTLRRWAKEGKVKHIVLNSRGDFRFVPEDLRALLKEGR